MAHYPDLRAFITHLEGQGQLLRVKQSVSSDLEFTALSRRSLEDSGPALLFENVTHAHKGHELHPQSKLYTSSVLTNLFGTVERVAMGLNCKPSELRNFGHQLAELRQPQPPASLKDASKMLPLLKSAMQMRPTIKRKAACQEIIIEGADVDVTKLPIQTCWPDDVAPLITWPLVVTQGARPKADAEDSTNLGIYRMQPIAKNKLIVRWLKHRGGAQQFQRWKGEELKPFPIAAVIGADPGTTIAAVTPVPSTLSEYAFAGLLRGEKLTLTKCHTNSLMVPANAEIVLEGTIDLNETADEGPYGDHTGFYNAAEPFPVMTVHAITMRKKPIYHSTYTGKPPDEPSVLGEALNEIFIPLIQQQFPEIVDFWLPPEGCSYRVAVVSIKKSYPGHAKQVMMGVWSFLKQFMYTKYIIVVDDVIDCRDWKEVVWAISTHTDPARDHFILERSPIDYLDFASSADSMGGKMGLDATTKIEGEVEREWGRKITMPKDLQARMDELWCSLRN